MSQEKKTEKFYNFKLDQLQWKDWYWTITTQFFKKLKEVEIEYKMRMTYDDSHFDDRIDSIWETFWKKSSDIENSLFPEEIDPLREEAEWEVEQVDIERQQRLYENPDILFSVYRNEVKEKKEWTIVKWSLYDKWIITRINERIEVLHNYKIGFL